MSLGITTSNHRVNAPDWWLLAITIVLMALGLIMVFSSSSIYAERVWGDMYYFFKRQVIFAIIGLIIMAAIIGASRTTLYKMQYPILFGCIALLIITLSPLGLKANGAQRWIAVGPVSIQPMEFAKIGLALYLAYFMATKQAIIKTFSRGVIPPFLITAIICFLLLLQPDFGGAALMLLLLFTMCLVGGTRPVYLIISALLACGAAYLLITQAEYRFRRILAFLDPFAVASDEGYHLVQSLIAFGSGGLAGLGLGASKQKLFYLPEAHTDFILAVFGEETGFIGMIIFFALVLVFFWRGFLIAIRQEDLRDRFTAFGILLILLISIVLNMAVVLGVAPPKGVPMPFFSYGGSSLVASCICVGFLLNISRTGKA